MSLFREYGFADEATDKLMSRYIRTLEHYPQNSINYKIARMGLTSELVLMLDPKNPQRNERVSKLKQAIMELK